jgi:hypothetical protein
MHIVEVESDMLQPVYSVQFGPKVQHSYCMEHIPGLLDKTGCWKSNSPRQQQRADGLGVLRPHSTRDSAECHFGSVLRNIEMLQGDCTR